MFKRLRRRLFPPDEYVLLQQTPERRIIDRLDEQITALDAESNYQLENGRYALQEIQRGRFGDAVWVEEFGHPRKARGIESRSDEVAE